MCMLCMEKCTQYWSLTFRRMMVITDVCVVSISFKHESFILWTYFFFTFVRMELYTSDWTRIWGLLVSHTIEILFLFQQLFLLSRYKCWKHELIAVKGFFCTGKYMTFMQLVSLLKDCNRKLWHINMFASWDFRNNMGHLNNF